MFKLNYNRIHIARFKFYSHVSNIDFSNFFVSDKVGNVNWFYSVVFFCAIMFTKKVYSIRTFIDKLKCII